MTREIEYRAYWKSKGQIHDVVDIYFGKKNFIQMIRVLCEHDGMSYPSDDICVDDFILMQYTGIKDKNGVKIFEGDVVRTTNAKGVVVFSQGSFIVEWGDYTIIAGEIRRCVYIPAWLENIYVIGNIYEEKK